MAEVLTIDLDPERTLHTITAGHGPDVVLLHGAVETSHDWLVWPTDQLLAEGCRVTIIDRPGHGLSRRPRFDGSPRDQAKQIRAGLDALGIERPIFVAHSYGCLVSLAYAELHDDAAALVLVAPLAFPEPRLLEHTFFAPRSMPVLGPLLSTVAEATIDPLLLKALQKLMFAPQEVPEAWEQSFPYEHILDAAALVAEGEDSAAILPFAPMGLIKLASIQMPVHVLTGTADQVIEDERQGKLLARLLPNARLTEVEGAGHMLHHIRPELVVEAVREALEAVQLQSSAR